jgi:NAD-dependent dihydropyrimidine dehydrogenase PreA subunit
MNCEENMVRPENHTPAVIDYSKCTRCGICIENCPRHIFQIKKGKYVHVRTDALCFNCGHCVALCPSGAISLPSGGQTLQKEISPALKFHDSQIEQFLQSRRSCRCYTEEQPSEDLLKKAIDCASHAPSGQNWPLVKWLVINDRSVVQQISRKASTVLHFVYPHLFRAGRILSAQAKKMYECCPEYCVDLANEYKEMSEAMRSGRDTILLRCARIPRLKSLRSGGDELRLIPFASGCNVSPLLCSAR